MQGKNLILASLRAQQWEMISNDSAKPGFQKNLSDSSRSIHRMEVEVGTFQSALDETPAPAPEIVQAQQQSAQVGEVVSVIMTATSRKRYSGAVVEVVEGRNGSFAFVRLTSDKSSWLARRVEGGALWTVEQPAVENGGGYKTETQVEIERQCSARPEFVRFALAVLQQMVTGAADFPALSTQFGHANAEITSKIFDLDKSEGAAERIVRSKESDAVDVEFLRMLDTLGSSIGRQWHFTDPFAFDYIGRCAETAKKNSNRRATPFIGTNFSTTPQEIQLDGKRHTVAAQEHMLVIGDVLCVFTELRHTPTDHFLRERISENKAVMMHVLDINECKITIGEKPGAASKVNVGQQAISVLLQSPVTIQDMHTARESNATRMLTEVKKIPHDTIPSIGVVTKGLLRRPASTSCFDHSMVSDWFASSVQKIQCL